MELKHINNGRRCFCLGLLIVPYGIETILAGGIAFISNLLIVPYGIETALCVKVLS